MALRQVNNTESPLACVEVVGGGGGGGGGGGEGGCRG